MFILQIKATLSVIEDERNRLFENFMAEQKARQELEGIYLYLLLRMHSICTGTWDIDYLFFILTEKFQKVVHDQTNLKNEKTHLENQYKNLQQRLEITTELYHQKENILHQ